MNNGMIKSVTENLKGHKLRVIVALFWIILGITSVVLVSSVGNGLKKEMEKSVAKVSPNQVKIKFEYHQDAVISNLDDPFSKKYLEEIAFMEGVKNVKPSTGEDDFNFGDTVYGRGTYGSKEVSMDISKPSDDVILKPSYGRNFSYEDEDRRVVIIAVENAIELFEEVDYAIGKGINIEGQIYEIIGVVDQMDVKKLNADQYDNYYMPTSYVPEKFYDVLKNKNYSLDTITSVDILISEGYDLNETANNIVQRLQEISSSSNGYYNYENPEQATYEMRMMMENINLFVGAITALSMFVGGVGIMNIMYVSVMERQREIGIRRAIGAKPKDILIQFILESVFITVLGGILGIIIGFIVVQLSGAYLPFSPVPNINSFLYAFFATILTGVIFGIIPAHKAAKLDPIKAIYK